MQTASLCASDLNGLHDSVYHQGAVTSQTAWNLALSSRFGPFISGKFLGWTLSHIPRAINGLPGIAQAAIISLPQVRLPTVVMDLNRKFRQRHSPHNFRRRHGF
ncbi:hypothetical protein CLAIMM_01406 [Cladophialophora immunda]|nr:hypothetical protein CLAIMM_01406 [Cladophialophora immunda]